MVSVLTTDTHNERDPMKSIEQRTKNAVHSKDAHGREGHLNVVVTDECDVVTSYGKHARVVAFHPDHDGLYVRVDRASKVREVDSLYPNLPDPSVAQILAVARKDQGIRGKWKLRSREEWPCGHSIDYHFDRA